MGLDKITEFARPSGFLHPALLEMRWCSASKLSEQPAATKLMEADGHNYLLLSLSEGARKYSFCSAINITIEATG